MTRSHRATTGGRIDRSVPIEFEFDGVDEFDPVLSLIHI